MDNIELYDKLIFEKVNGGLLLTGVKPEYEKEVEELIIPDSWKVVSICKKDYFANAPFEGNKTLKKVVLPNTLEKLNDAFCSCDNLSEVILPKNLKVLGNWNFRSCKSLETIALPSSLTRVGYGNFEDSPVLLSEYQDEDGGCIYLGTCFIDCPVDGYDTLVVKEGTTLIADCTCADKHFSEVIFPNSLVYIGAQAFYCCDNLKKVDIPTSVKRIYEEAFLNENGDLVSSCYVTDGYFDEKGYLVLEEELGFIDRSALKTVEKDFKDYLLKISYTEDTSYDNSDDDRVEDSSHSYKEVTYREIDVKRNSKALLRVNGKIAGVVFSVKESSNYPPDRYPFLFDDSEGGYMRIGYSASHSSHYLTVNRVELVIRGENGAPEKGHSITFINSHNSTSI